MKGSEALSQTAPLTSGLSLDAGFRAPRRPLERPQASPRIPSLFAWWVFPTRGYPSLAVQER